MHKQRKRQDKYQRAIFEIGVEFKPTSDTPPLPHIRHSSSVRRTKISTTNKCEQIYNELIIQQNRVSRDLESHISARERELFEFRENSQNAVISPLLTQALVRRTQELLENLPSFGNNNDGMSRKSSSGKFRKHAKIICVLCSVFKNWKRFDVDLLLKIGSKLHDEKHNVHQTMGYRVKKSTLTITFDTRNFAIFQSKISGDIKECLMKQPFQRSINDQRKISSVLSKYKVFQMFSEEKQTAVSRLVGYERYEPGRVICLQARNCDRFYFILSGLVSKVKTMDLAAGVKKRYLHELHQGSYTDLYETLRNEERTYSLICKTEVEVFLLEREDLQDLFYNSDNELSIKRLINSIDLFKTYPCEKLFQDNAMKIRFYAKNTIIETSVHESPCVYIIKTGSCNVYMKKSEITKATQLGNRDLKVSETKGSRRQFNKALSHLPCMTLKQDTGCVDYIFVKSLLRGDIYGLQSLLPRVQKTVRYVTIDTQSDLSNAMVSTILVSNGAECLLVNKNKFLKHSDFFTLTKVMSLERVLPPSLTKLHQALRWSTFKETIVNKLFEEA